MAATTKKVSLSMLESFFGWPALTLSVLLTVVGIFKKSAVLILVAMLLTVPGLWYLVQTPRFALVALLPPLVHMGLIAMVLRQQQAPARRTPAP
jgi:hypothetical protein